MKKRALVLVGVFALALTSGLFLAGCGSKCDIACSADANGNVISCNDKDCAVVKVRDEAGKTGKCDC
jgi:hypothetical protein